MTAKEILTNEMEKYENLYDEMIKKASMCIYPPLAESYYNEASEYQNSADLIRSLIVKIEQAENL